MPRWVSLVVLALLIVGLGLAFLQVMLPYLLPLMVAGVLALLCQPLYLWCLQKVGGRRAWAAGLTTAGIVSSVLIPILVGTLIGAWQLIDWSREVVSSPDSKRFALEAYEHLKLHNLVARFHPWLGTDATPEEVEQQVSQNIRENLPKLFQAIADRTLGLASSTLGLLGSMISLLTTLGIFIVAFYYFLADGPSLVSASRAMLPLAPEFQTELINRFVTVTRAVVVGTFLAAIAQGLATGVALWLVDIPHVILLTILATITAIIPLAGTWLVWLPCAVWMIFTRDQPWLTVIIFSLYNLVFVGLLDNVIRTYLLNSDVKLHPLLALISILGGLQWIGLWGVFVGPIVAACLHALINIFNQELVALGRARETITPPVVPPPDVVVTTHPVQTASPITSPAKPAATAPQRTPNSKRRRRR